MLESERPSESHEKLNISVVYLDIIEPAMLTESFFFLFFSSRVASLARSRSGAERVHSELWLRCKKYNDNEVFIDSHIEFCLKKLNINDPSYALVQRVAQGRCNIDHVEGIFSLNHNNRKS